MGYAFISYSTKNQQMADSFRTLFNQKGIKTWMAPGDIPFGSTYTSTINRAIKEASCFVLLLSESAQGSKWVPKETERAVSYGKTIFTILLDDVPMNDDFEIMLSTSQAMAIRKIDESDEKIKKLIISIRMYTEEERQNNVSNKDVYLKNNVVRQDNKAESVIKVRNLSVSNNITVQFGNYPQNKSKQLSPIEWVVLKYEEHKALILSKNIIDCIPYNKLNTDITWQSCTLRNWLNVDFLNLAFSKQEQDSIVENQICDFVGLNPSFVSDKKFFKCSRI